MVGRAVIALAIVLPHELPVGLFDDGRFERHLRLMQLMGQKVRFDMPPNGFEVRRRAAQAKPDIAAYARAVDGLQAVLRLIELAAHVPRGNQPSVERVRPLMIRTYETRRGAALRGADSRAAMPARIVECTQSAFAVVHDDDRILSDLNRHVVAGAGNLAVMADEQPIPIPDHVQIDLVIVLAAIEFSLQGGLGIPSPQTVQHGITRSHDGTIPTIHRAPVRRCDVFDEIYDNGLPGPAECVNLPAMAGQLRKVFPRRYSAPAACLALCIAFASPAFDSAVTGRPLLVGTLELRRCPVVPAYCGTLDRPLDPTGAVAGRIAIHFEYYPHSGPGKPSGTLVATEGGPGYPATLSRDAYLALFKPLRRQRDLLLMDNRGTGESGAIDCRELQTAEKWTVELTAACGRSLSSSAPLYSTAYAADDLAAILQALDIRRIDLYGDSYGTYFEQVFAVRHPNILRSIVLDGAYPLNGADYPWYSIYAPAMREKFDIACRRFAPCARLAGTSI